MRRGNQASNPSFCYTTQAVNRQTNQPFDRPTIKIVSGDDNDNSIPIFFFISSNILLCTLRIIRLFVRSFVGVFFSPTKTFLSFFMFQFAYFVLISIPQPRLCSFFSFLFCFAFILIYLECIFVWAKPAEAAMCVRCRILIQSPAFIFSICVHNNVRQDMQILKFSSCLFKWRSGNIGSPPPILLLWIFFFLYHFFLLICLRNLPS